jgi:hypothetical protein
MVLLEKELNYSFRIGYKYGREREKELLAIEQDEVEIELGAEKKTSKWREKDNRQTNQEK